MVKDVDLLRRRLVSYGRERSGGNVGDDIPFGRLEEEMQADTRVKDEGLRGIVFVECFPREGWS